MLPPSRSVGPQTGLFHTGSVPDSVIFSRYASGGKPADWAGYKVRNLRAFTWHTRMAAGGSLSTAGCVDERQDNDRQERDLLDYAERANIKVIEVFNETLS